MIIPIYIVYILGRKKNPQLTPGSRSSERTSREAAPLVPAIDLRDAEWDKGSYALKYSATLEDAHRWHLGPAAEVYLRLDLVHIYTQ
jgi:hypothetical protein